MAFPALANGTREKISVVEVVVRDEDGRSARIAREHKKGC